MLNQIFSENEDEGYNIRLLNNTKFRLINSPPNAKQLLKQLRFAIEEYEADKTKIVTANNNSDK